MNTKKDNAVHFILAGDTNELKLESIISISPSMKQIVSKPTRQNQPGVLDTILTTLSNYYQTPEVLPPLDNDPDKNGKPSDHNIVIAKPISEINNTCSREKKESCSETNARQKVR